MKVFIVPDTSDNYLYEGGLLNSELMKELLRISRNESGLNSSYRDSSQEPYRITPTQAR